MWNEQNVDGRINEKVKELTAEFANKADDRSPSPGAGPGSNTKDLQINVFEDIKEEDEDNATSSRGHRSPEQNSRWLTSD